MKALLIFPMRLISYDGIISIPCRHWFATLTAHKKKQLSAMRRNREYKYRHLALYLHNYLITY